MYEPIGFAKQLLIIVTHHSRSRTANLHKDRTGAYRNFRECLPDQSDHQINSGAVFPIGRGITLFLGMVFPIGKGITFFLGMV